jgi:hypothetical protein
MTVEKGRGVNGATVGGAVAEQCLHLPYLCCTGSVLRLLRLHKHLWPQSSKFCTVETWSVQEDAPWCERNVTLQIPHDSIRPVAARGQGPELIVED